MSKDFTTIVVIYQRPKEHPQGYVVRRWYLLVGYEPFPAERADYFDAREQARAWVEKNHPELIRLPPIPCDDPAICDTYL